MLQCAIMWVNICRRILGVESNLEVLSVTLSELIRNTNEKVVDDVDRTRMYLDWLARKTDYINSERKPLKIPNKAIPKSIDKIRFVKLPKPEQKFLSKFYSVEDKKFVLSSEKSLIDEKERERIARDLLLARGKVCWVDFGFNIGSEYGGRHPAIILKNYGNTLLVVPLTSQDPKKKRIYILEIPFVFDFQKKKRWAIISSLTTISTHRVDFNGYFGRVKGEIINEIRERIQTLL